MSKVNVVKKLLSTRDEAWKAVEDPETNEGVRPALLVIAKAIDDLQAALDKAAEVTPPLSPRKQKLADAQAELDAKAAGRHAAAAAEQKAREDEAHAAGLARAEAAEAKAASLHTW